ncbi:GNAT family N-acetyltransferase [Streptosporangium sp. NPDC023615]|uniref:GNAT family N-acetyltransferase n=1 Tax=Streptosporangium sp. NPDC023615 TaxID=3154794 RepID=UPI003442B8AE
MTWTFTSDVETFAEAAEPWLLRDPVRNTVVLTVLRAVRMGLWSEGVLLGRLERDGRTVAVALQTPPHFLLLADIPTETVPELVTCLIEDERVIPGVSGSLALAEAFAARWWRPEAGRRSERLYRLSSPVLPEPAAEGALRVAEIGDLDLLVRWGEEFQVEAEGGVAADLTPLLSSRITRRELGLWEVDGRPVAFAGASCPLGGMSRIGPVYTPPPLRKKGYGTALSHAMSVRARAEGADEVLLFTDLSNPTSNSIYQAIGYRPVDDYATVTFG